MASKLKCLAIEDSLVDQKMMKRALLGSHVDLDLDFAGTLDRARAALETGRFSVILCDNNLPDGSGAEFAQELASDPDYRDTAIILVSGWPSPFMWAKARAAGVQIIDKNDQPQLKLLEIFARLAKKGARPTLARRSPPVH